mgnify:CR=1 FL=1
MKIKKIDKIEQYKLCYVEDNFAWFTKLPLNEQWGDDWDDAPYECNAGIPYDKENLVVLSFMAPCLYEPRSSYLNSPYSVEAINNGACAWLTDRDKISIVAGCGIEEFISKIKQVGGIVFGELE